MITALGCKSKSNRLVAEAGPDQTVVVGQTVHLEGHGSSAAGGEPLRFQWTGLTGPAGSHTALTDAATATPSFVADQVGTYVVQLVAVAGGQTSDPSIVRITVIPQATPAPETVPVPPPSPPVAEAGPDQTVPVPVPPPSPPVAEAGPDQTVVVGQTVHLEGHGSSAAGGEPLRFQWTGLTGPAGSHTALTDAATATPSFVADQAGTYVVQLVVVAGGQASAPSIVRITAVPPPATVRNLFHTGTTPVTTYTLISPLTPQDTLPPRLPGVGLSEEPAVGANLLGSVLVFPKFDIRSGASTQLRITDTSQGPRGGTSAFARLNFVCPGTKADPFCDVLDIDISFTYHRTVVIDVATELPPCDRGFIIVFAEGANGNPVSYNHLTGSYHITSGTGPSARAEAANAIAIQSLQPAGTALGAANANTGGLDLTFSTTSAADYAALPAALHSDFRAVTATSSTILTLLTLNIISGADNPTARVNVHFWNAQEVPFSASHEFVCWDQVSLDQIDRHFTAAGLGTGNGALRITPSSNCPASRFCPPFFFYNAAVLGVLYETGSPVE